VVQQRRALCGTEGARVNRQLDQIYGLYRGTEGDRQVPGEGLRISEAIPFRNVELNAQRSALELRE
jgi:hypothetical protein